MAFPRLSRAIFTLLLLYKTILCINNKWQWTSLYSWLISNLLSYEPDEISQWLRSWLQHHEHWHWYYYYYATSRALHRCSLLLQMSHVAWSVSLCVGHTNVNYKNSWTNRNAVWRSTQVSPRNHVLDGGQDPPTGRGNFRELSDPLKSTEISTVVSAVKGIIQSSIRAWQPTPMFPTGRCHVTLSIWKICPPPRQNSLTICYYYRQTTNNWHSLHYNFETQVK